MRMKRTVSRRPLGVLSAALPLSALAIAGALSCGGDGDEGPKYKGVDISGDPPEFLSDMNLMRWDGSQVIYEEGVEPYDLANPLFSDYAVKNRAIFIPEGSKIQYRDVAAFEFPVGTVILKSFMFPADLRSPGENIDLVETRVLVHYEDGWKAFPYLWDHEIGDAVLKVAGDTRPITFVDLDGQEQTAQYLVPQKNQCADCHTLKDLDTGENYLTPIGPKARHMNRESPAHAGENQLTHLADAGWLEGLPAIDQVESDWAFGPFEQPDVSTLSPEDLNKAARDYLDINCAHCHNPAGVNGISSQLFLNYDNADDFHLGVCKKPGSAGAGGVDRDYDIVPGDAEASILVYRTETLDTGAMMPLLGRSLHHAEGVGVLRAWIDGMAPVDCLNPNP